MKKNNIFSFIGFGPTVNEINLKNHNKECQRVRFNKNGETEFYCNNKVFVNYVRIIPLIKPIECYLALCFECLEELRFKYKINFKKEIPILLYLSKAWTKYDKINYNKYQLIKDLNLLFENDKNFIDPEKRWFNDIDFLLGLPVNWLKRFKLYDSLLKGDCNQGELNGPDYIFEDISNNKLIGFEIVSIKWNIHHSFNDLEMVGKFARDKIFNLKSYDDRINEFKNIINCKSKKNM